MPAADYNNGDDPLRHTYTGLQSMGISGADGDMVHGVVRTGPRKGQWHALKYRKPGDDPQREIDA